MGYIGRFAPSPSGPLHFGSLVTALGSYLQAKFNQGKWLVRIEDIDSPREVKGAACLILTTLEKFGLYWDNEILYQSKCHERYHAMLTSLLNQKLAYYCDCRRKRTHQLAGGFYDGYCRTRQLTGNQQANMAIRLRQTHYVDHFFDSIHKNFTVSPANAQEDFILYRRDGLFAYNWVVVLDDHWQGVTEIVRGADLLPVTPKHISLYKLMGWNIPNYCHLPLAVDVNGLKLSKQNHAAPLDLTNIGLLTVQALEFLGQTIPPNWQDASQQKLLDFAVQHWQSDVIPRQNKSLNHLLALK